MVPAGALKIEKHHIRWLTVANTPSLSLMSKPALGLVAWRLCRLGC